MGAKRKVGSNQFAETWVAAPDAETTDRRRDEVAGGVSVERAAEVDGCLAELWSEDQRLAGRAASLTEVGAQAPSVRAGSSPWVVLVPYPV